MLRMKIGRKYAFSLQIRSFFFFKEAFKDKKVKAHT